MPNDASCFSCSKTLLYQRLCQREQQIASRLPLGDDAAQRASGTSQWESQSPPARNLPEALDSPQRTGSPIQLLERLRQRRRLHRANARASRREVEMLSTSALFTQPLIYRLIINLGSTFFVKIKVELWYECAIHG